MLSCFDLHFPDDQWNRVYSTSAFPLYVGFCSPISHYFHVFFFFAVWVTPGNAVPRIEPWSAYWIKWWENVLSQFVGIISFS